MLIYGREQSDSIGVTVGNPTAGPSVSKIVLKVEEKGPNYRAIAEGYSDKGVTISGDFFYPDSTTFLNSDTHTVGRRRFAKLESTKVQGAKPSDVFTIMITSPASGVQECSVSVHEGSATCLLTYPRKSLFLIPDNWCKLEFAS